MWPFLGPTGPRWALCWPHELCYLGTSVKWTIANRIHILYMLERHTSFIYAGACGMLNMCYQGHRRRMSCQCIRDQ